jgi:hypothetical protein
MSVAAVEAGKPVKRTKAPAIVYKNKASVDITDEKLRLQWMQFMQLRSVLFTKSAPCVYQTGAVCLIEVPIVLLKDPNTGADYCVGLFPEELSLGPAAPPGKTIVWSLIQPTTPFPAGTTFTFFDDKATVGKAPSIIVLSDKHKQLNGGTLGDGTLTVPDPTKYLIRHKHTVPNRAVYLPIVVRTDNPGTASEKVSVCGTPDPTIAND